MKDTKQEDIQLHWYLWITVPQNGAKLRESVLTMAEEWKKQGFVDDDFITLCK